ncbi:MAG: hypothetical protein COB53_00110 [Elusimicrobia bacterium]|nr:MAG: hypothetical protein COB53_00110 [Elusimicrobiota bacterium]
MKWKAAVWIFAGLLYLLWPYDVIPDFLAFVGWVDDILIVVLAIYMAAKGLKKKLERPGKHDHGDVIDVEAEDEDN